MKIAIKEGFRNDALVLAKWQMREKYVPTTCKDRCDILFYDFYIKFKTFSILWRQYHHQRCGGVVFSDDPKHAKKKGSRFSTGSRFCRKPMNRNWMVWTQGIRFSKQQLVEWPKMRFPKTKSAK